MAVTVPVLPTSSIKVVIPIDAARLPIRTFPLEGPAPNVTISVTLTSGETLSTEITGRSFRRLAKSTIPLLDAGEQVTIKLQANLIKPGVLASAGFLPPVAKSRLA